MTPPIFEPRTLFLPTLPENRRKPMPVTTRQGRSDLKRIRRESERQEPPPTTVGAASKKSRHAGTAAASPRENSATTATDVPTATATTARSRPYEASEDDLDEAEIQNLTELESRSSGVRPLCLDALLSMVSAEVLNSSPRNMLRTHVACDYSV